MMVRRFGWARSLVLVVSVVAVAAVGACDGGDRLSEDGRAELDPLVVSGGDKTGVYYGYGESLASVLGERLDVRASVTQSGGSIDNLRNLADGSADVAFSAADAAVDADSGRGSFDQPLPVQAVARLYDDFVHLVVPTDSAINTIHDLRGRSVSLGGAGSGTDVIAHRLLSLAGLDADDVDNQPLGIDRSIEALRAGDIDAFFWSGGLPTPGVQALAADFPIRLIPLQDFVEGAREEYGSGYRHGVVPEGTYGLRADVSTMAVPNFLMVRSDLADDAAYEIVDTLFAERATLARKVPAAALLDRSRAIFTEPVDLHPGVLRYYREHKTYGPSTDER